MTHPTRLRLMGLGAERRSHRFSAAATARLEEEYARNPIPSRETRCLLARELGVSLRQVQVWLQNKRQRTKAREASKPQDPQLKHDGDASIVRAIPYAEAELPPSGLNMEIFVASYPPFPVLWASMDWLNFCGFNASEISGATLKILQGKRTDKEAAAQLVASSMERCCGEVSLINYTKHGTPFRHTVCVEPLVNSYGQLRVFVARSKDIQLLSSDHIGDASSEE